MTRVLQHVVIFRLEDFSEEKLDAAVKQLALVVEANPGVISASFGKNADNLYDTYKQHTKGFTHTLLVTFKDEQALKAYDTEPTHIELGKLIIPYMKEAIATDTVIDTYPELKDTK